MELWIRSQDKMKLVSNCNLYISNEIRNEYVIEDLNNKYLKLGTYKTKERVLEILDEIEKYIEKQGQIEIDLQNGGKYYGKVYEMPKE